MAINPALQNALKNSLKETLNNSDDAQDSSIVPTRVMAPEVLGDSPDRDSKAQVMEKQSEALLSTQLGKIDETEPSTDQEKASPPEPLFTAGVVIDITDITCNIKFTGEVGKLSPARLERAMFMVMRELQVTHATLRREAKRG